jgi:hypothetical protein
MHIIYLYITNMYMGGRWPKQCIQRRANVKTTKLKIKKIKTQLKVLNYSK